MLTEANVKSELLRVLRIVEDRGKDEIRAQGHVASGRGLESVEAALEANVGSRIVGVVLAEDYMVGPVNDGVKASRVPFSPGSGAATSLYIQALIDWIRRWIKPGYSEEEAKSFAFAIAYTAKEEGHPTKGSYSFTSNGRRTAWVDEGLVANEQFIEDELNLFALLESGIADAINRATK